MSDTLTQKHFLKGTYVYEIVGDQVNIRIKSRRKEESLSVTLAVLNPEPVITRSHLNFVSRVNGEILLSFVLPRTNVIEFNDFISTLKQKALTEYYAISGMSVLVKPSPADKIDANNPDIQPLEFPERSLTDVSKSKTVNVEGVENAINMLETYVDYDDIQPLITALKSLKQAPRDHLKLVEVATVFNNLGSSQGAVLTYAPYISIMLSDDPFE